MAVLAGTTVETAIRLTNRMRKENLPLMQRGKIVLHEPQGPGHENPDSMTRIIHIAHGLE